MQRIQLILLVLWLASCGSGPVSNRYQQPVAAASTVPGAVAQLQSDARRALADASHQNAIEYLQRAIRIEPRNAESWYLLAETYRRSGDLSRCLDMGQRAASHGRGDAALERDIQRLLASCGAR